MALRGAPQKVDVKNNKEEISISMGTALTRAKKGAGVNAKRPATYNTQKNAGLKS